MITTRGEYQAYLRSNAWQRVRWRKIQTDGDWIDRTLQTLRCTCTRTVHIRDIEIHHRHYRTLGNESLGDLEISCIDCHAEKDANRGASKTCSIDSTNSVSCR